MGVNHSIKGTETVNLINNLALITRNIGRPGASPFSITGQCNAMGTREAGFTSSLPGYRKFESAKDREDLAGLWNVDVSRIPTARGLAYPDIIEGAVGRKIRAFDDVRIRQATRGGDAAHVHVPQSRQILAVLRALELPVPRQRRGEACFARAHGVALPGD